MSTEIPYSPHWPIICVLLGTHAHIQCPHSVHCRNSAMAACLSCIMVLAAKGDPSSVTLPHSKSKCSMLMCVPACCVWQDWTGEDSGIRAAHCGAAAGPQHFRDKATAGQDSARHRASAHPRARKAGLPFTFSHALHPISTLCSSSHNRLGGSNTSLKSVKDGQISEHILAWCMADRTSCCNI